jgi:hypothetical protein
VLCDHGSMTYCNANVHPQSLPAFFNGGSMLPKMDVKLQKKNRYVSIKFFLYQFVSHTCPQKFFTIRVDSRTCPQKEKKSFFYVYPKTKKFIFGED